MLINRMFKMIKHSFDYTTLLLYCKSTVTDVGVKVLENRTPTPVLSTVPWLKNACPSQCVHHSLLLLQSQCVSCKNEMSIFLSLVVSKALFLLRLAPFM